MNEYGPIGKLKKDMVEIYQYRNMLFSLVRKDLFGRYKNSFIGFIWHFITPMIMLLVYFVVYSSGIRSAPIDDFIVYISSVLFPFSFMVTNLTGGAGYITGNGSMLKKMYFPREIAVLSHVISSFIIMILGYIAVLIVIGAYGFVLNPLSAVFVVAIFAMMFIFVLGYTLLFSSLTVYVRDVQYFLQSINIVFMFVTPMYFTVASTTGLMSTIIWLNPFTYFVEALHSCIYFKTIPGAGIITACLIMSVVSLIIGFFVFRRLKRGFVERL